MPGLSWVICCRCEQSPEPCATPVFKTLMRVCLWKEKKKKDNPFHLQPMRKVNVKEREGLRDFILFSFFPPPKL